MFYRLQGTARVRSGKITASRYFVGVATRWNGHTVDVICDGEHITITSGTRLVRTLDADPTLKYQPVEPGHHPRGTREPQP